MAEQAARSAEGHAWTATGAEASPASPRDTADTARTQRGRASERNMWIGRSAKKKYIHSMLKKTILTYDKLAVFCSPRWTGDRRGEKNSCEASRGEENASNLAQSL